MALTTTTTPIKPKNSVKSKKAPEKTGIVLRRVNLKDAAQETDNQEDRRTQHGSDEQCAIHPVVAVSRAEWHVDHTSLGC